MPRPICVPCRREMKNVRPIVAQFNARAVGDAYEQWHGDVHECEGCGAQVVVGYGERPSWRHHEGDAGRESPGIVVEER